MMKKGMNLKNCINQKFLIKQTDSFNYNCFQVNNNDGKIKDFNNNQKSIFNFKNFKLFYELTN